MNAYEDEVKHEFQLERIIFFSDAVFAIAITLLIIDIRIPYHEEFTSRQLWVAVGEKIPELIGFFISFFFIGGYWLIHHKMFGYVRRFDTRLIWLNLIFLLSIVLLPFSTSIFGMYAYLKAGFTIYIINAVFTGIMNFFCWKHVLNPRKHLTTASHDPFFRKTAFFRSLLMPAWFFICGVIALLTRPEVGQFLLPVTGVLYAVTGRRIRKKEKLRRRDKK